MNDYDDSDRYAKTSGFGIGELGQVPEYDPADVLAQPALAPAPSAPRWEMVRGDQETAFDSLDDMLAAARLLPDSSDAFLSGPDYTVGNLYSEHEYSPTSLKWRREIRLDTPVSYCEECGGPAPNGRCTVCGERDMIATSWHEWENHTEVKIGGEWVEVDPLVIEWTRRDGYWYCRTTSNPNQWKLVRGGK